MLSLLSPFHRKYRMRTYSDCFVGKDAVDWMTQNLPSLKGNRGQAVDLGRRMLALRLIAHVKHEHDFEDSKKLYRFEVRAPSYHFTRITLCCLPLMVCTSTRSHAGRHKVRQTSTACCRAVSAGSLTLPSRAHLIFDCFVTRHLNQPCFRFCTLCVSVRVCNS